MAKYNPELYVLKAQLCKTFADPKRLLIIEELRESEKSVSDLVQALKVPQGVVSRHLAILRDRGVVKFRRNGANVYYRLSDPKICEACDMVHKILLNQIANNRDLAERLARR